MKGVLSMWKGLWMERNFGMIWSGQFVSQLGDKFYGIALAWWVLERTHSPLIMGLLMTAAILPQLLLGPIAGGFIDRWDRKRILIGADLLRSGLVLAVTLLSLAGRLELWHIFGAAVLIAMASAFYNPTVTAALPQIVAARDLPRANSASQVIAGITTTLGPAAGAAVISLAGFNAVFLFNSLSFLVSGVLASFIDRPLRAVRERKAGFGADLRAGLLFILGHPRVLAILAVIGLAHLAVGSLTVTLPVLARQLAGAGVHNLGWLEMMIGCGMLGGSIALNLKKVQRVGSPWLFGAAAVLGACLLGLGILRGLGLASVLPYLGLMALAGAAVAVASVFWASLLQRSVPNELAGRVFSIAAVIGNTSMPLAYAVFGLLLSRLPIAPVMGGCGAGLMGLILALGLRFGKMAEELGAEAASDGKLQLDSRPETIRD
ncbi:putative MFS family arabinose efflux permease [Hydrogenispora ethanolica]|uniref:Putative MFS family arabinose efflux permease n=2 Tax=Hydrogenispora ethanolica TaxID=1082276 RepID=A0A4R1S781_HYDET|nr:putative MFS family arabinose efflux permease [Hydrogenispora ethanolica]